MLMKAAVRCRERLDQTKRPRDDRYRREKLYASKQSLFSAAGGDIIENLQFFSEFTEKLNWREANERDSTELQHISPLSLHSAILIMSHLIKLRSRNQWESGVLCGARPRVSEPLISRLMSSRGEMEIDSNEFMLVCVQLMRRNQKRDKFFGVQKLCHDGKLRDCH